MSVARGNGQNGGHFYSNITQPVKIDLNFIVDATNGNGLGVRSVKSNGYVNKVYMNTSAAFTGTSHTSVLIDSIASTAALSVGMPVQGSGIPAGTTIASIVSSVAITLSAATSTSTTGSITYQGVGSPNPAAGYAYIQMNNNYNYYLGGFSGFVSPVSGSPLTSTTRGLGYIITTLGTTTLAQWQAAGVPPGVVPAVGLSFVAKATGAIGGTGAVEVPSVSGVTSVEIVGDPNKSISNSSIASNGGAWILAQFLGSSVSLASLTFTGSALAPHTHDFTVIGGQAASTTNNIANYSGPLLGKEQASNATYIGANSASSGGVVAVTAGTPAGSISAETGTVTFARTAPANESVCSMSFFFDASSVTIDGL